MPIKVKVPDEWVLWTLEPYQYRKRFQAFVPPLNREIWSDLRIDAPLSKIHVDGDWAEVDVYLVFEDHEAERAVEFKLKYL